MWHTALIHMIQWASWHVGCRETRVEGWQFSRKRTCISHDPSGTGWPPGAARNELVARLLTCYDARRDLDYTKRKVSETTRITTNDQRRHHASEVRRGHTHKICSGRRGGSSDFITFYANRKVLELRPLEHSPGSQCSLAEVESSVTPRCRRTQGQRSERRRVGRPRRAPASRSG